MPSATNTINYSSELNLAQGISFLCGGPSKPGAGSVLTSEGRTRQTTRS